MPTLANWPGTLNPGKFESPAHISDWMPTLCALAGYQDKVGLKWDGRNLWPALTGQPMPERLLYWAGPNFRAKAVRLGDWKLIVSNQKSNPEGKAELFDLSQDPNETTDLAAEQPAKVTELRHRLAEIEKADRDSVVEP